MAISLDGTSLFAFGEDAVLREFTMSTAFDLSTATQGSTWSGYDNHYPKGLDFNYDGTKMYVLATQEDVIEEYTLSTAWDITSTITLEDSFDVISFESSGDGLAIDKVGGLNLYVAGSANGKVKRFTMSTALDLTSLAYSTGDDITVSYTKTEDLCISTDGKNMIVFTSVDDYLTQYDLTTAWDSSTASYSKQYDMSSESSGFAAMCFSNDGTMMYAIDNGTDKIYSYSLA